MPDTRPTFRDLLALRSYIRFWGTRLLGTAATQMLMVAIGWQMYDLTGSAWDPVSYTHLTLPTILLV